MNGISKACGLILASLLGFQSSVGFCVCHPGESDPPPKVDLTRFDPHTGSRTDEHPCHSHAAEGEPSHPGLKTETNEVPQDHDEDHSCCCLRKDESAVKSEACTFCFQKGKFSSLALQTVSVGKVSFGMPLLGKYCQAHAPPHSVPLFIKQRSLLI